MGEKFESGGREYRNLVFQPNKNANNNQLKQLAAADSHQVLARLQVPVDDPPTKEELAAMAKEQLEKDEESG